VTDTKSLYERVGGSAFFVELVDRFYEGVAGDPLLRPLYPEDLTEPKQHLRLFLIQYWGGPADYGEMRGHPRLRMRHAPFVIGELERDAWLRHMTEAVDAAGMAPRDRAELLGYFDMAARQLVNTS
jgi:hemoglobin